MSQSRFYKDSYGWKAWAFIASILFGVGVLCSVVGLIIYHLDSRGCARAGYALERDTWYDFWGAGCFVETDDGRLVPLDNYRVTDEEET